MALADVDGIAGVGAEGTYGGKTPGGAGGLGMEEPMMGIAMSMTSFMYLTMSSIASQPCRDLDLLHSLVESLLKLRSAYRNLSQGGLSHGTSEVLWH